MPPVHRQTDLTCGHGCYPPEVPTSWSPNVRVNGLGVVRYGDSRKQHCCNDSCHGATYIGTARVRVNGRYAQHVGHPLDDGDSVCNGSPNVNFG